MDLLGILFIFNRKSGDPEITVEFLYLSDLMHKSCLKSDFITDKSLKIYLLMLYYASTKINLPSPEPNANFFSIFKYSKGTQGTSQTRLLSSGLKLLFISHFVMKVDPLIGDCMEYIYIVSGS